MNDLVIDTRSPSTEAQALPRKLVDTDAGPLLLVGDFVEPPSDEDSISQEVAIPPTDWGYLALLGLAPMESGETGPPLLKKEGPRRRTTRRRGGARSSKTVPRLKSRRLKPSRSPSRRLGKARHPRPRSRRRRVRDEGTPFVVALVLVGLALALFGLVLVLS